MSPVPSTSPAPPTPLSGARVWNVALNEPSPAALLSGQVGVLHHYDPKIFGPETELPKMLYFECPYAVLEKRILGRAKYSGRSDDNVESMKQRFDTFKAETLPTVEFFKRNNKCVQVDTSQDRQTVYALVYNNLAEYTDRNLAAKPLTERAEILLGLRADPPSPGRRTD